ncbi:YtxH domain-containing protein [Alkalinema sp. FACHB-956]|uniref:YtxH domain-containing protein n=1 Tax=Alkalinema sp. FACHB-956 TaxID=2692768 RepID=UPI00168387D4|nr:YtxH domain-containing protein [Alkalinema sp. FACHB-956]MBD2329642.1 YtxH domain-containing protein [Alkalinema sp. FACHB-956]
MAGNRSGAFISGLLIGAAAGAIAGLLTAPRTGRETRKLLKKSADALPELAEDLSTTVQIQADRLSETALKNWDETLNRLRVAIAAGVEASQRVREDLQVDPEDEAEPEASPVPPRRYISEIK